MEAGYNILRAVGFPVAGPEVITCPTCGRTQYPCTEIANEVEKRLQGYKKSIKVAVMGCVVNGPGEAREAISALQAARARLSSSSTASPSRS